MRTLSRCSALAGLLLVGSSALWAQHPQVRKGFWIGFGIGYGSVDISCNGCGSASRQGGATGFLKLGGTLSPSLLLGGEVNAWSKTEGDETVTLGNVSAVLYYYPALASGFFLRGGVGLSDVQDKVTGDQSITGTGAGFVAGVGYDLRVGRNVSITPVANFLYGAIGELSQGGASSSGLGWKQNYFEFGLGVTFH